MFSLTAVTVPAKNLQSEALPSAMEWTTNGYILDPAEWKTLGSHDISSAPQDLFEEVFRALPTKTFEQLSPSKKPRHN